MNEDLLRAIELKKKLLDDQSTLSQIHQLAFGTPFHQLAFGTPFPVTTSITTLETATTQATAQPYATGTVSQYYKKNVEDRKLFMYRNSLKIITFNVNTISICDDNSVYEFEDTSAISSKYAITEYFNIMYYDKLLIPGFKLNYEINDTKNVIKHLDFLTQKYENIAQHKGSFSIGRIKLKWETLHKALI